MSLIHNLSAGLALVLAIGGSASAAPDAQDSREISAQRRPSITIYPRQVYPGRYATRHCDAWLAKEYRISGPVVVPQKRCYWR